MWKLRRALFPTQFEDLAYPCVEQLLPLKAAGLEEIVFLYVIERDEVAFIPFGGFDRELAEELREKARLRFEDWGKALEEAGLWSRGVEEVGDPAPKILEALRREDADLVVTGRQRPHPADAVYLGGTAMELLRRSPVPVLVCKQPEGLPAGDWKPLESILFATDFSAQSRSALEFLRALAPALRRVGVLHVIPPDELEDLDPREIRAEEDRRRARLEEDRAALEACGLAASGHLLSGDPAEETLRHAAEHRFGAIAAGTRGKSGLREFLTGSVSHRLAESSPIPVLVVPILPAARGNDRGAALSARAG